MRKLLLLLIGISIFGLLNAQNVVFHENFELPSGADSVAAYSSDTSSIQNTWGISTDLYASGMRSDSAKCSPHDTLTLTTNPVSMTGNMFVVLDFDHICKIEVFDKAIIEVSTDGGLTWSKLDTTHYMGASTKFGDNGNVFNVLAYSNTWKSGMPLAVPDNSWWKHETFDLSSIAGNMASVSVRFSLIDLNGVASNFNNYGWFLDNIEISGSPSEMIPPAITFGQFVTDTISSTAPQTITAEITDNSGIDTAYLVYYLNGILTDTLGMTNFMADSFTVDIPFQGFGRTVTYYIEAKDLAAIQNIASTANKSYYLKYQPGSLSSVVFSEGFNTGSSIPSTWTNTISGFWERPGGNHSSNTGPSGPYEGTGYVAVEASGSNHPNVTGSLVSPVIDLSSLSQPYMIFYFHMYGSTMGDLNVDVYDGSTWHQGVWTRSGQQHASKTDPWTKAMVDLTPYKNAGSKIRFRGTSGSDYYSDMSVDDVKVGETQLPLTDAGVVELTNPTGGVIANTNFDVKAKVKNYGGVDLTKVDVNWELDGIAQTTHNLTNTLTPGDTSAELTLGAHSVAAGPHSLKLWTSNPNDTTDFNISNDTLEFGFYGCANMLSGTYNIGGTSPGYNNFSEAVLGISQCGISGPVTFNVASGVYTEQISIPEIPGASSTNTIIFKSVSGDSTDVVLKYDAVDAGDNYVIEFDGADYITFQGITVEAEDATFSRALVLKNAPSDVSFSHNVFTSQNQQGDSDARDLVHTADSVGNNITFNNNRFVNGSRGLVLEGNVVANIMVEDNEFYNQYTTGITLSGVDAATLKNNFVSTTSTYDSFNGIALNNALGAFEISYNEIYASTTVVGYGIMLNFSEGDSLNHGSVYNNMMLVNGNLNTNALSAGILNQESRYIDYYYNTVKMTGADQNTAGLIIYDSNNPVYVSGGLNIKNNIFSNFAGGYAAYTNNADFALITNNYNNFYTDGAGDYMNINGSVVNDIAGWQSASGEAANSESIDPYFVGPVDLHASNNLLNGLGTPVSGITDDIDGDLRNALTPDMGADEFDPSPYDIALIELIDPVGACGLTSTEPVAIRVKNIGSATINSFNASFSLGGGAPVTETISTAINAGDTLDYTFTATVDLDVNSYQKDSIFAFVAWINNVNDPVAQNDSVAKNIHSNFQPPAPIVQDTTIMTGDSVTLTANSSFAINWFTSDTTTTEIHSGQSYTTPQLLDTTTYWVAAGGSSGNSPIIITEFSSNPDDIELMNISNQTVDATGWQLLIKDNGGVNNVISDTWTLGVFAPGEIKVNGDSYSFPSNLDFANDDWLMLVDDKGNIMDFVVTDYSFADIQTINVSIAGYTNLSPVAQGAWNGPGVNSSSSYIIRQTYDANDATDWTSAPNGNFGQPNPNISALPGFSLVSCLSARVPLTVNVIIPDKEAQPVEIITNTECGLGMEPVTISILNAGADTINGGITAAYRVDNNPYITPEQVNVIIPPQDTGMYTFNTLADLSGAMSGNDTNYVITAYVDLVGDTVNHNDTVVGDTIESLFTPQAPITSDTTILYGTDVTLTALSSDTLYWFDSDTAVSELSVGKYFTTPLLFDTTTYWVESRAGSGILAITEVTQYHGYGDGPTSPAPPWLDGDDFVEITNLGSAPIDLNGYTHHREGSGAFTYNLPNITLGAGEVLVLATYGGSTADPSNNFYIAATSSTSSGSSTGHWLTDSNGDVVDAVALNGHTFTSASGVTSADWSGNIASSSGHAGVHRDVYDSNTASDWTISTSTEPQTLGTVNPLLGNMSGGSGCASDRMPVTVFIKVPGNDAGITSIVNPTGVVPQGSTQDVKVELINEGLNVLTSVDIFWQLDGTIKDTINWTGTLQPMDMDTVTLASTIFTDGGHSIKAWTGNPNGVQDSVAYNDTSSVTFGVCMNGSYTIGDTTGGGTYDFTSFNDALYNLQVGTICGDVVLNVADGVYYEQLHIPYINGVDTNKTIRFISTNGDSTLVTLVDSTNTSSHNYTVMFDGSQHISFENMTIQATGQDYNRVIVFDGPSSHIKLLNNIITTNVTTSTSNNHSAIYSSNSDDEHILIKNNQINNGSYGIYMDGSGGAYANSIIGNEVSDFYRYGIYLRDQDSALIKSNKVYTASDYYALVYGIYAYYCDRSKILANSILVHAEDQVSGIRTYYCDGTTSEPVLVANNTVRVIGGDDDHYGLYLYNSENLHVYYNTVMLSGTDTDSRAAYIDIPSYDPGFRFMNNILIDSIGYVLEFDDYAGINMMDYNIYYTTGTNFIDWDGTALSDLTAFRQTSGFGMNSGVQQPVFESFTDLHLANGALSGFAEPISEVTDDIDGNVRSALTPYPGADEREPLQTDIAVVDIVNISASVDEFDNVIPHVVVANIGIDTVFNYAVEYTVGGGTPISLNITNDTLLPFGHTDTIVVASYISPAGLYQLCAEAVWAPDSNIFNNDYCMDIFGNPKIDATISNVKPLASGCGLTTDTVTVTIRNDGYDTIPSGFTAKYLVDGITLNTETVNNQILPGDSITWDFTNQVNLAVTNADSVFDLEVWVEVTGDNINTNDTGYVSTTSLFTPMVPIVNDVTIPYGSSADLIVQNPSNAFVNWYYGIGSQSAFHTGDTLFTTSLFGDTTFWFNAQNGTSGSPIIITEFSSNPDMVEVTNITNLPFDATGWEIVVNDNSNVNYVESQTWTLGQFNANEVKRGDENAELPNLGWVSNDDIWVMLIDDKGEIKDFVSRGYTIAEIQGLSVSVSGYTGLDPVGSQEWIGGSVATGDNFTYRNTYDSNDATDWVTSSSGSPGTMNPGMTPLPNFSTAGCTSPMDSVNVFVVQAANDAAAESVTTNSGCDLGMEPVTISVVNTGTDSITGNLSASYKVDNNPYITPETVNVTQPVAPGDTIHYTFNTLANLAGNPAVDTAYVITAYVNLLNDPLNQNDTTISDTIKSLYTPLPPIVSDTTITYGDSVTISAISNDVVAWYDSPTATSAIGTGSSFNTPILTDTTTYWAEATSGFGASPIIITEFSSNPDDFEIQNISGQPFDATGWQVIVCDGSNINNPVSATWTLGTFSPGEVKVNGDSYNFPTNLAFANDDWIMIIDNNGNIMDFVASDYTAAEIQGMNVTAGGFSGLNPVTANQWSGPGVNSSSSYVYRQTYDSNDATDWTSKGSGDFGQPNVGLQPLPNFNVFNCQSARVPVTVFVFLPTNNAIAHKVTTNTGCALGMEPVTIDIVNAGSIDITGGLTAAYRVDSNPYITPEVVNITIPSMDTVSYTFSALADLNGSLTGDTSYNITAYVDLPADVNSNNDTVSSGNIISLYTPQAPITSDTLGTYNSTITLTAASNDTLYWFASDSATQALSIGKYFTTPVLYDTITYWVEARSAATGCAGPRVPLTVFINVPDYNAGISDILVNSGCNLTTNEPVTLEIVNYGAIPIDGNITAAYRVNGATFKTPENVTTVINPGDTGLYTFNVTHDMLAPLNDTSFVIEAYVALQGDTFPGNDTMNTGSFKSLYTPPVPVVSDTTIQFGTYADITAHKVSLGKPDTIYWYNSQTGTNQLHIGETYTTPLLYDTTTYWVSTKLIGSSPILITEVELGSDHIEIQNVSGQTVDATGWKVLISASYSNINSINVDEWDIGVMPANSAQWRGDVSGANDWGANMFWNNGSSGWAMIVDDQGEIVDFLAWDWNVADIQAMSVNSSSFSGLNPMDPANEQWTGDGLDASCSQTMYRITADNNNTSDFTCQAHDRGTPNALSVVSSSSCESARVPLTVNVTGAPPVDAQLDAIVEPATGQLLTTAEPVTFRVLNNGTDTFNTVQLSYNMIGGPSVTETANQALAPGDTLMHTFSSTVDLSNFGPYTIQGYIDVPADTVNLNDSLMKIVENTKNYCISRATSSTYHFIENVSVTDINNTSTGSAQYTDFTNSVAPAVLYKNVNHNMSVTFESTYSSAYDVSMKVFIDANRDGVFDETTETFMAENVNSMSPPYTFTNNIKLPANAATGLTVMRVVLVRNTSLPNVHPCGTYTYGETEDYLVHMIPLIPKDAGIVGITRPAKFVLNANQQFHVVVKNFGSDTIHSVDIDYSIAGTASTHTYNTSPIPPLAMDTVNMPILTIPYGNGNLCASTSLANDTNAFNDGHCTSVYRSYTTTPPYVDGFEQKNYFMQDTTSTKTTLWELGYPMGNNIIGAHGGNNAWVTDLNDSYNDNMTDVLYSPKFAIGSQGVDSLVFWHYMDVENGADGGYVQYQNVTGHWTTLGQANDPTATNWYTDTIIGQPAFTGNTNGWIRSAICIDSAHVPNMASITQFRFVFVSDGTTSTGDGWAIDDFEIKIPKVQFDAGVRSILNPVGSTITGDPVNVEVELKNYGSNTLTNIPVVYKVGTASPQTETWTGNLLPDATTNFSFTTTFNGPANDYKITAYTQLLNDGNHFNDTSSRQIVSAVPALDAGVVDIRSITNPSSGPDTTWFQKDVQVVVTIKNFGSSTLTSMDVEYQRGSLTPVTESWTGSLLPDSTVEYTFTTTYVSGIGNYTICSRTLLTNDADPSNNETCEGWHGKIYDGIESNELPGFVLHQNLPNPANSNTSIDFEVPYGGNAIFEVVDLYGRTLKLDEIHVTAGRHTIDFDVDKIPSGVYYYHVTFDGHRLVKKMTVVK